MYDYCMYAFIYVYIQLYIYTYIYTLYTVNCSFWEPQVTINPLAVALKQCVQLVGPS